MLDAEMEYNIYILKQTKSLSAAFGKQKYTFIQMKQIKNRSYSY